MIPDAIIIEEMYTYFIAHQYKFIENDIIEEGILLISPDLIVYHIEKCGVDSFKKIRT